MRPLVLLRAPILAALLAGAPAVGGAQSIRTNVSAGDSIARIVPRHALEDASFAIVNRERTVALLLLDSTIVLQPTRLGLDLVSRSAREDSTPASFAANVMLGIVVGVLRPLLDHGIEYQLSDLGTARYEQGRLLLLRRNGKEVFGNVEFMHGPVMESFDRHDAEAFATRLRRVRGQLF